MSTPTNIIDTVRGLISDASLLLRQEVKLAKVEAEEKLQQAQTGLVEVAAGLVIALVALLVLVQALIVALGNIMPPSLAALGVGIILAVIAYFAVSKGQRNLKPENLAPKRTVKSVQDSVHTIKEAA